MASQDSHPYQAPSAAAASNVEKWQWALEKQFEKAQRQAAMESPQTTTRVEPALLPPSRGDPLSVIDEDLSPDRSQTQVPLPLLLYLSWGPLLGILQTHSSPNRVPPLPGTGAGLTPE